MLKEYLGKKLKVGDVFSTQTKKMLCGHMGNFKLRRTGDKAFVIKGKRRYWCEVVGLLETKIGWGWITPDSGHQHYRLSDYTLRKYYQLTYLVRILET